VAPRIAASWEEFLKFSTTGWLPAYASAFAHRLATVWTEQCFSRIRATLDRS